MGLQLTKIFDPRDTLDKARRKELERFAEVNGVSDIDPQMPAQLMRRILRSKGLTHIPIPNRTLGQIQPGTSPITSNGASLPEEEVESVTVDDDLLRQWESQKAPESVPVNNIADARRECKRRGIKIARTDKLADLKAKLDGEIAS